MDRFQNIGGASLWKKHLYPLYIISGLIMVRSIFRVIEYAMGSKGYLLSHEWSMYIFDSLLMFAVTVIWAVRHPSGMHEYASENSVLSMEYMEQSRGK